MNEKIRTVAFTLVVTAFFTFMVSGVNALLKERIDNNKIVARQKVILSLLGLNPADKPIAEETVPAVFAAEISKVSFTDGTGPECYRLNKNQNRVFVVAFTGQGFWDNISGFVALDMDTSTISGLEFTQHGETPGLGGRISEPEFKARFKGKPFSALRSDGLRLRIVAEGSAVKPDEVDGITGATGTSNALEKIINNVLASFIKLNEGGKLQ